MHDSKMADEQFIDIRVENLVHESNARGLEGVLVRELNVDLPYTSSEGCYVMFSSGQGGCGGGSSALSDGP